MKRPWMPLYVGDYLGDTGHLTTTQHGAYLLLMMHYWRKGELPDDDKQLSKITKLPLKVWTEYRETLQDFFYDGWKHKRIEAELHRMMNVSAKRAIAGQKGGLGSALSRMKLEAPRYPSSASRQAIAQQTSSPAAANVDHSHSQRIERAAEQKTTAEPVEKPQELGNGKPSKPPPIVASPELVAIVAAKRTA